MGKIWVRVSDCGLCGNSRCVVNVNNERMGYCYRFGRTYFRSLDGDVQGQSGEESGPRRGRRYTKGQKNFDFGFKYHEW